MYLNATHSVGAATIQMHTQQNITHLNYLIFKRCVMDDKNGNTVKWLVFH